MLTIDLGAIQQNWLTLTSLTKADVAGVVKANAYGLGAKEVANSLFAVGCKQFFFATFDEAVAARVYLPPESKLYVLGGLRLIDLRELCKQDITPVLCSGYDIEQWLAYKVASGNEAAAALKINTGMTRFGLDEKEFSLLCDSPETLKIINPELLMSHLSSADDKMSSHNPRQLERFSRACSRIKTLVPSIRASLANSSGIFLGDAWHFDLVRPGAALYGVNPMPGEQNPMVPVFRLELPVLQVRSLSSAEHIGYSATAQLSPGARIAVLAGGYADGIHRTLGARKECLLLGQRVKILGRISMDSLMIDISDLPHSDNEVMNALVEVVGAGNPLDDLMQNNQTLGYEVLTSLGSRYKRKYLPGVP